MSAAMPEWLKASSVFEILGVSDSGGRRDAIRQLKSTPAKRVGSCGRPPILYRSSDIVRVASLVREAGIDVPSAVRVVIAENEGRL